MYINIYKTGFNQSTENVERNGKSSKNKLKAITTNYTDVPATP